MGKKTEPGGGARPVTRDTKREKGGNTSTKQNKESKRERVPCCWRSRASSFRAAGRRTSRYRKRETGGDYPEKLSTIREGAKHPPVKTIKKKKVKKKGTAGRKLQLTGEREKKKKELFLECVQGLVRRIAETIKKLKKRTEKRTS